jgi:DNA ligase-1
LFVSARQAKDVKTDLARVGDLGLLAAQSKGRQSTLCKPKPLTVAAVYQGFKAIAAEKGSKSMEKKV